MPTFTPEDYRRGADLCRFFLDHVDARPREMDLREFAKMLDAAAELAEKVAGMVELAVIEKSELSRSPTFRILCYPNGDGYCGTCRHYSPSTDLATPECDHPDFPGYVSPKPDNFGCTLWTPRETP